MTHLINARDATIQTPQNEQPQRPMPPRTQGLLRLSFLYDQQANQTRMMNSEQRPPLKVIRAFAQPDGGTLVHLHNISGGVLGGDQLQMEFDIGPQASVQLTSTSATRIYRSRPGVPTAQQQTRAHVQSGGLLEYLPDPLIPFAGARYRQHTEILLEDDAGLCWWEMLTPGRVASGERFAYEQVQMGLEIKTASRPILYEHFSLEPQRRSPTAATALGEYHYLGNLYLCRVGKAPSYWLQLEKEWGQLAHQISRPGECIWGVSALAAHGLVIRALSQEGRAITAGLLSFWKLARPAIFQREAILPRKVW
jgi:urease accessory protein